MKFCTNCGTPVRQPEPAQDPAPAVPVEEPVPDSADKPDAVSVSESPSAPVEEPALAPAAPVEMETSDAEPVAKPDTDADTEQEAPAPVAEPEPMPAAAPDALETTVLDTELQEDAQAAQEATASLDTPIPAPVVVAAPTVAADRAESAAPEAFQVQPTVVAPAINVPVQQSAPSSAAPQPKKSNRLHTGLLIAAVCLLAVIAVGVGYLVVSSRPLAVTFGQGDAVPTSLITRIKPRGSDGKPLTSYIVSLVAPADSENQEAASQDTTPYKIQVEGGNGFTMADFGVDVPDGNYTVVVEDTTANTQQQFPITYEHENPQAKDEVTVEPPAPKRDASEGDGAKDDAEDGDPATAAAKLFYDKTQEYVKAYGSPQAVSVQNGYETMMLGLCVAQQIDFNDDGTNELLLVYNPTYTSGDEVTDPIEALNTYVVEVWAFKDNAINKVYSSTKVNTSNGGMGFCTVYKNADSGQLALSQTDYNHENDAEVTSYYVLDGDEFKVAQAFQLYNPYSSSPEFSVDGETVDQSAYRAAQDAWVLSSSYSLLEDKSAKSNADSGFLNASDAAAATEQTIADLKKAAGVEAAESKDKSEDKTSKKASYAVKSVSKTETFQAQGDGYDSSDVSHVWSYPVISVEGGKETKAVKALNAAFKKSYKDDLAAAKSWTLDSDDPQTWWHRAEVTSIADGIVSLRLDRYLYGGGIHGNSEVVCTFYSLETGKEIDAADALGISDSDMKELVAEGIRAFFEDNPSDLLETASDREEVIARIADQPNRIFRTDDAIVVHTGDYELGSYAFGTKDIVIKVLGGDVSVGDSISDRFKES